jgi:metal-responsive CopG/Arc/MetJ family transcriptional regulator
MTTISVRLPDPLLKAAEEGARALHVPRSEYFRLAIEEMNRRLQEQERRQRLMRVSQRVRVESMAVNAEFEAIEHDSQA